MDHRRQLINIIDYVNCINSSKRKFMFQRFLLFVPDDLKVPTFTGS